MAESRWREHVRVIQEEQPLAHEAQVIDIEEARRRSSRLHTKRTLANSVDIIEGVNAAEVATPSNDSYSIYRPGFRDVLRERKAEVIALAIVTVTGLIMVGAAKNAQDNIRGPQPRYEEYEAPELTTTVPSEIIGTPEEREGGPDSLPTNFPN